MKGMNIAEKRAILYASPTNIISIGNILFDVSNFHVSAIVGYDSGTADSFLSED